MLALKNLYKLSIFFPTHCKLGLIHSITKKKKMLCIIHMPKLSKVKLYIYVYFQL